jgi:gamma-glutamylcyclotransferase (GGCT)/AIG2-like uncharacterized protein YtfP
VDGTLASEASVNLFVNGTLMRGLALHGNLLGAQFLRMARTAARYRLYSVRDEHPAMIPAPPGDGAAVAGEIYNISVSHLQRVLEHEPSGLGLGVVDLNTGEKCLGILWTASHLPRRAMDISAFGGWREYQESLSTKAPGSTTS